MVLACATSTVINYFYACIKPVWFKFGFNLEADKYIQDVISAMKKERPGRRGAEAFSKWSLQGLLKYLNSDAFEPLENASWRIIRCKLLILIFLNTGRRNGEIGTVTDFDRRDDEVIFKWFPDFLAKME